MMRKLPTFDTVLIANRGEIACRIMHTIKDLGMRSVAVYSDADRNALHVEMADDAVNIGPSAAAESYLVADKIIAAAKSSGAQAIHPGYGFQSENAEFATACTEAGLVFIGPSAKAISLMGDKAAAKRRMIEAGVPTLNGYQGVAQEDGILIEEAAKIGFPLMVKAAAGGGGRGMRLVVNPNDLNHALASARTEALSAFGSDTLILEKAVIRPRHVEIQIFGDSHGNIIHLGERDCSVQRRHQKVLEEAPCPIMDTDLRASMGDAAVAAAKTVDYVGAGTVEFLLDSSGAFYFLEMNTRLQVEHPVTEMITSLDLVALQIQIAQGHSLGLSQDDIQLNGHAIEARLYAEDPSKGFLPATGRISHLSFPTGVRVDSGVKTGSDVSPFYDPMIAKFTAWGPDRETARRKLVASLQDMVLFGVATNREFLIEALTTESFVTGEATTAFISENFSEDDLTASPPTAEVIALAGITQYLEARESSNAVIPHNLYGWSSAQTFPTPYQYGIMRVEITAVGPNSFSVKAGDRTFQIDLIARGTDTARFNLNGRRVDLTWLCPSAAHLHIQIGGRSFEFINTLAMPPQSTKTIGEGDIRAPLHGALTEIFVSEGDTVTIGTCVAVVEAMKMQHDILADIDGSVETIFVKTGTQVGAGAPLFKLAL
jgi:geranyl-CoA carboxylase alpha subunit